MIQSWLLFPLVLSALSLGWGLVLRSVAGRELPGVLLVPLGFAGLLAAARLLVAFGPTVQLATPLIVLIALAGYALLAAGRCGSFRVDGWAAAAAVGVFVVFAAPVVLSGSATFAGYGVLGDTAVQFTLVDALMSDAGDVSGLGQSAFKQTVETYKSAQYPLGTHAALGAVRPLAGTDVAWIYQPYLVFLVVTLCLSLCALLGWLVESPRRRAVAAFVAAQPALVFSFALQGSIKELATLALVPLVAALVLEIGRPQSALRSRELVPLIVAAAALIAAVGPAALLWLGPMLVWALVLAGRRARWQLRTLIVPVVGCIAALVLAGLPTLISLASSVRVQGTVLTANDELGNLIRPLELAQVGGIWLGRDYRVDPGGGILGGQGFTRLLLTAALLAAVGGAIWLVRRRSPVVLYLIVSLLGLAIVVASGSPWAVGKALVIASPAVMLAAVAGTEWLRRRNAMAGVGLLALLAGGVLASNAIAYSYASFAPRERFEELSAFSARAAGGAPTLSTEFEEFTKHFLRDGRPVGASELATPGLQPSAREDRDLRFGLPVDLDDLTDASIERFPSILLRRSPVSSRPNSDYRLMATGRYYELWRRRGEPRVVTHLPLGSRQSESSIPDCGALRRLAASGRRQGASALVGAVGQPRGYLDLTLRPRPRGWTRTGQQLLRTVGRGTLTGELTVVEPGSQTLWLRGSFGRVITVFIDGRRVGEVANELAQPANWIAMADVELSAGRHSIRLERGGRSLAPQSGDADRRLGQAAVTPDSVSARSARVPIARWRELCGSQLDWVDAVRAR